MTHGPSSDSLRALVATVATFYVKDKALLKAQRRIEAVLAAGEPSPDDVAAYLRAVERYFTPFAGEARAHLVAVERQLQHVFQVQFNLNAEREVAQRRIEATQGVLRSLEELRAP